MSQITNTTNNSWSDVWHTLTDTASAVARAVSAVAHSLFQANVTPEALGVRSLVATPVITSLKEARDLAEVQRNIFVRRMSAYSTLKTIYESVCKMPTPAPSELFYEGILDNTNSLTQKEFNKHVSDRFFALVDQAPISLFRRFLARLTYLFIAPEISYIIDSFTQRLVQDIRGTLDQEMVNDKCEAIGNHNLKNLNDYLKELCEIYEELKKSSETGNIDSAIQNKLKERLTQLGYPQQKINLDFVNQFLQDYPVSYSFNEIVDRFLKQFDFSEDSALAFLNPVLEVVYTIVYMALWVFFVAPHLLLDYVLPEKVGSNVLPGNLLKKGIYYGFESFVSQTDLIGLTMDSVLDAVNHKGFSYTLNTNLTEMLSDLCHIVQSTGTPQPDPTVKLSHLEPILKHLFTVLGLSHLENIEDLKKHSTNPDAPFQLLGEGWKGYVNKLILEGAVEVIPEAFELLVNPLEIEKLMLTGFTSLNTIYDLPVAITDEQIATAKENSRAVKDKLINLVTRDILKTAASKKLGFIGKPLDYFLNTNLVQDSGVWVADTVLKQRTDALVDRFLLKSHHYSEGGINRLALLPYLKAHPPALRPKNHHAPLLNQRVKRLHLDNPSLNRIWPFSNQTAS